MAAPHDPAAARFLSRDPIEYAGGDVNLYRYAGNDPVNRTDPSGLQDTGLLGGLGRGILGGALGIGGLVIGGAVGVPGLPTPSQVAGAARGVATGAIDVLAGLSGELRNEALRIASQVGPCAGRLSDDALAFALRILRWEVPSVGALAGVGRPAGDQLPSAVVHRIYDLAMHPCLQLLPGYGHIVSPLLTQENRETLEWVADKTWRVAGDPAAALQEVKNSPQLRDLLMRMGTGVGRAGELGLDAITHGPRGAAHEILTEFLRLIGDTHGVDVEGPFRASINAFLPAWDLPDEVQDIAGEVGEHVLFALKQKVRAFDAFVTGGGWWGVFLEVLTEQLWPWGPPLHDHGVVNDFLSRGLPALIGAVADLWDTLAQALRCPKRGLLDLLAGYLRRGSDRVVDFWGVLNEAFARLELWLWVLGQVLGSFVPVVGNVAVGAAVEAVQLASVASAVGEDLAGMLLKLADLVGVFLKEDAEVEAELDAEEDQIDRIFDTLGVRAAAEFERLLDNLPDVEDVGSDKYYELRGQIIEGLLDRVVSAAVAGVGALIGGAAVSFGRKTTRALRKLRRQLARKPRPRGKVKNKRRKKRKEHAEGCGCDKCQHRGTKGKPKRKMCLGQCPVKPGKGAKRPAGRGMCFAAETPAWRGDRGRSRVDGMRLGRRALTWLPGEPGHGDSLAVGDTSIDPAGWRAVWLVRDKRGGRTEVGLLRPLGWLAEHGARRVGDRVRLDLPEMGAVGTFRVVAVEPCPAIESGPGRVVTGVFRHSAVLVYNLWVAGEPGPVGVTPGHPFWSPDRHAWVAACELRPGERVAVAGGTAVVLGLEERGDEPTYNLEVDGDHCYRVGEQGILVHNQSTAQRPQISRSQSCGQRLHDIQGWDQRDSRLREAVFYIHEGARERSRNLITTAVGIFEYSDSCWECVYAVSGNDVEPEMARRANQLGYRLVQGLGSHAEQIILRSAGLFARVIAVAPCRRACRPGEAPGLTHLEVIANSRVTEARVSKIV